MSRRLGPLVTVIAAAIIAGCGDSDEHRRSPTMAPSPTARPLPPAPSSRLTARSVPDVRDAQRAIRAFARAVISANARRICPLVRGAARRDCGDLGPRFRLTIRRPTDVRLVRALHGDATAAFPRLGRDPRGTPRPTWCHPQLIHLRRRGRAWRVVAFTIGTDFEPLTAGCQGLAAAVDDATQSLPLVNASEGRCPPEQSQPLDSDALDPAGQAALRQAPVLYPATDLRGMRVTRAIRATADDPGPGGYARLKCGRGGQARTVVIYLEFPAMRPSASLSQGRVLVSRFEGAYRTWALLH
jgi:hypothetical protein